MPRLGSLNSSPLAGLGITRAAAVAATTLATYNFEGAGIAPSLGSLTTSLAGTVTTSSSFSKTGSQSAVATTAFRLTLPQSVSTYAYSGGFTIEGFIYPTSNPASYISYIGVYGNASSDFILVASFANSGQLVVDGISNSGNGSGNGLTLNAWNHVFMTWYNGNCFYGSNGVYNFAQTGAYKRDPALFTNLNQVSVGYIPKTYGGPWDGAYVDQMRASSTYLYVANPLLTTGGTYTVPTTPLN